MESKWSKARTGGRSWRQRIGLVVISIFVTLILLEVGIRTYDAASGLGFFSSHRRPRNTWQNPQVRPFRTFGYDLYVETDDTRFISSRWGELYPLDKPEDTFRIVAFGGSTTENRADDVHYPLLLQTLLRERTGRNSIEVINVGYAAYATPHSLILLELDVLEWDPDLVILSHNINDLLAAYWPDFAFDYSNKYSHSAYNVPDYRLAEALFQDFQLYWVLDAAIEDLNAQDGTQMQRESYGDAPDAMDNLIKFKFKIK